jgi:hypothetical protein
VSTPDTIVVMRSPGETRTALLAGDDLIEVVHRRDRDIHAGSAGSGRVVGHAPGFAFIDIGDTQPGVLKVKAPLVEGTILPVRIVVPARAGKGAELARADKESPAPEPAVVWWERYGGSIEQVLVSPSADLRRFKVLLPGAPLTDGGSDPFAHLGIDAAIEAARDSVMPLPGGGRVIVEATSAAICIDIDAGATSPAEANTAAVDAIARMLRLHNLAGHILIDVIPGVRGAAKAFAARLTEATAGDPIPVQIAGVTPLGMVELTRRREGLSLAETLADATANACYAVLRQAVRGAHDSRAAKMRIVAADDVIARLQGPLSAALAVAQTMASCEIALESRPAWPPTRAEAAPA